MHRTTGIMCLLISLISLGCSAEGSVEVEGSASVSTSGGDEGAVAAQARVPIPANAMDMVPGRMQVVARFDHAALRDSGFEEAMMGALHAQVEESERPVIEYLLAQTDGLVFGLDMNASGGSNNPDWMVIVSGRYSGWSMLLELAGRGEREVRYYEGFVNLSDEGDDFVALVLDDGHLLLAPAGLVDEILDTARDPAALAARTAAFSALADEMGFGAHTLEVVAVAPESLVDEITSGDGGGMSRMIAGPARDIVGLTASLELDQQIHITAGLHFIREQAALDASALARMILAMGAQRADDPRIREVLSVLQVSVDGVRLVLDGSMETDRFLAIVEELARQEQEDASALAERRAGGEI